ncbi:MAG: hypothetical protein JNM84_15805 [Planctomycetes bacterium]|nr:hypothetical protein [Planctomycetota bacterium]
MIALLAACASNPSNAVDFGAETLRDEFLQWGDVGDSRFVFIGEVLCGDHARAVNLLKVARIPFRGSLYIHMAAWVEIAVPESRADEGRDYLESFARRGEFVFHSYPRT